ncbi:inorganic phosphate transporter [Labilibaculum sp. A4]|uniref:inorganic phosphate transporter n=1 Tax=Labilibaculum euxinus TaxID=2686357 RepID=UPI000F61B573|nr:inorganic phosphate transporter [Labilibaculum euxinus]MDQ1771908.1 anion permease [Labilibaculum euxinus]MWN77813.1 inorganic phosphate transporter [Labilibaculum euxinus]
MLIPFLIPFVIAIFLSVNMGGSGTGPAFSAAYGSNVIKKSLIPGLFGLMVFTGAIVGGKETAKTVGKGLLDPQLMSFSVVSAILLAVAVSLLIANLFGIPQSTSQSTVMAVTAPAIYFNSLNTNKLLFEILPTWFIMPIVAFALAFFIGKYIYKPIRKRGYTISKKVNDSYLLKGLIVIMSLYVAFSIGTNNVANAAGPLSSMACNELMVSQNRYLQVMILATLIVAPSFSIGSSVFGDKILQNTGKEIVLFGRIEAVIIAFISASLLLSASLIKGIPTSLVQLNVGAIIGIGVAKLGFRNIFRKTEVDRFFVMWIIAPMVSFGLSLLFIYLLDIIGLVDL